MSETPMGKNHTLMLDNRRKLVLTGAVEVNGFNEETVSVKTTARTLIVKGSGLHVDKLNLETGDVTVSGTVNSLQYIGTDNSRSRLSKLFR